MHLPKKVLIGLLALVMLTPLTALGAEAQKVIVEQGGITIEKHAEDGHGSHKDDHHGESAGLPQFDPSTFTGQVFWLAVAFAIMYIFFSRKTLPDISGVIESRQERIQNDLDSAEKFRQEAEDVHQAYEEALDKARKTATDFYLKAEESIKAQTAKELKTLYDKSVAQLKETEERIEKTKAEALEDMNAIAAEIAREVAEKVVGISTDLDQAKTVVQSIHKRKAA